MFVRTTRRGESGFAPRLVRLHGVRAGVRILIEDWLTFASVVVFSSGISV